MVGTTVSGMRLNRQIKPAAVGGGREEGEREQEGWRREGAEVHNYGSNFANARQHTALFVEYPGLMDFLKI